jgi:phosphoribosylformylglycinamidine synthase subunit PurQ / glutaminase
MRSAVVVFPGINRERDMARALELTTGQKPAMVWHTDTELPYCDLVVVPGGFSFGDYLRCGAIAARSPIMEAIRRHAATGRYVLGVCNGFQILTEAGLLPGALVRNASVHFICRETHLKVVKTDTPFAKAYRKDQVVTFPVAHGEGNYVADEATVARLEGEGRVVFRYCDARGVVSEATNLNGSINNIAGILNDRGNVMGMMPHPENHVEGLVGGIDGRGIFEGLAQSAVSA